MSGEDDFIRRHFAPWAGVGALGLRDDVALLRPPADRELVITTDAIVAGVHFLPDDPPGDIAKKALRVNLSDLAAKGAEPLGFLLTLALPSDFKEAEIAAFTASLREDSEAYACPLLGGDTVATPGPLTVSITALGSVPEGRMVPRAGARLGDRLFVSGTIGDAALGLLVLRDDPRLANLSAEDRTFLVSRYRVPQPRVSLMSALRSHAWAGMDVSDGLAGDLAKLLSLENLGASIPLDRVPLSHAGEAAIEADDSLWEVVLAGGDDYEVLCTVPYNNGPSFAEAAGSVGVAIAELGIVENRSDVVFTQKIGQAVRLDRLSFSHV